MEKLLKTRLNNEGLHPHIVSEKEWFIEWKQDEIVIPLITARDLVEMGFFPPNERFGSMLNQLRGAIIEGVVPRDVRDAQIDWIRKNFN